VPFPLKIVKPIETGLSFCLTKEYYGDISDSKVAGHLGETCKMCAIQIRKTVDRRKKSSYGDPRELKLSEFLDDFVRQERATRRFCFITGAGASKESGIRTGAELVQEWMQQLKDRSDVNIDKWIKDNRIDPDNLAAHYSKIYDKRFECDPMLGLACLEKEMDRAEPSCGYSVLAQILANTNHNVVITVNFDSMIEDAMFAYTRTRPLVCGHESLVGFIRPVMERPLIAKIHHHIFYAPKSSLQDTARLSKAWVEAVTDIFKAYTPVVIGYGANDGSVMGFLEKVKTIEGGTLFWCYRAADGLPGERIRSLVTKRNGWLISIDGFDDMMIQLNNKLGYPFLDKKIIEIAEQKAKRYREQIENIEKKTGKKEDIKKALEDIIERRELDWWSFALRALWEQDNSKRDLIYRQGLNLYPNNPELLGQYALFLGNTLKTYEQADELFRRVLEIDPNDVGNVRQYAVFLAQRLQDYASAELYFRRALELDPGNSDSMGAYATFLWETRKNYELAEKYFENSVRSDPNNAKTMGAYATFLNEILNDYDRAEEYYRRALELDPGIAVTVGAYATFLAKIRRDYKSAEEYYKKALELDPSDANITANYGNFLARVRKDYDQAEKFYKQAIDLDPGDATINGNYANFLAHIRQDYDGAEELFKKALQFDPDNANTNGNYAQLLIATGRKPKAKKLIDSAFARKPDNQALLAELLFYLYANFYEKYGEKAYDELLKLIKDGARSIGWNFTDNIELAKKEGHPHFDKLEKLAKIITEDAPISILDS
jgi:protein O-mannosyl-transferase